MKYDCIIITGNVGTGKTTLANELMKKFSSWSFVGIDEIRKKYGDGTMEKERDCQEIFRKELEEPYKKLIECTGYGEPGLMIEDAILYSKYKFLIIHLKADKEEIFRRIENRKWDTPFPASPEKINDFISRMQVYDELDIFSGRFKFFENAEYMESDNYQEIIENLNNPK